MVHNRLPFLEVLSFQADFAVSDHLFEVSAPIAIDGAETKVVLKPRQNSFFGNRVIHYNRFDLSEIPRVKVKRLNAKTHSDLARNLQFYPLFKYRVFDARYKDQIAGRYLHLQPQDVQDEILPNITIAGYELTLVAHPNSDCFVGGLKISLI
jgi:hypothetical protein